MVAGAEPPGPVAPAQYQLEDNAPAGAASGRSPAGLAPVAVAIALFPRPDPDPRATADPTAAASRTQIPARLGRLANRPGSLTAALTPRRT
jgi:hypothetical protein